MVIAEENEIDEPAALENPDRPRPDIGPPVNPLEIVGYRGALRRDVRNGSGKVISYCDGGWGFLFVKRLVLVGNHFRCASSQTIRFRPVR